MGKRMESQEVVESVKLTKLQTYGVVDYCVKLNVRSEPRPISDIIWQLPKGTEVMIEEELSTEDYYKIVTASGADGYCLKKYITTK